MKNKIRLTDLQKQVFNKIITNGGKVYFVGGIVRDLLLYGRPDYLDIDVEIYGLSLQQLKDILSEFGTVNEQGKAFGILKLSSLPEIDFALPRIETKNGNKHQDFIVEINQDLDIYEASMRRDFTINALMYEYPTGNIIDLHHGLEDLKAHQLRMINPNTFKEDPLRVLRAARFKAQHHLTIEETTSNYCKEMVARKMLDDLSSQRVYQEYCKILMAKQPSLGIETLASWKALPKQLQVLETTMQRLDYHPEGSVMNHTLLVLDLAALVKDRTSNPLAFMWSCLFHDLGKAIVTTPEGHAPGHNKAGVDVFQELKYLIPSIKMQKYIEKMIYYHMHLMNMFKNNARDIKYLMLLKEIDGYFPLEDLIYMSKCDKLGRYRDGHKEVNAFDEYMNDKIARLGNKAIVACVTGQDLQMLGIEPSKHYQELLDKAYHLQLQGLSKQQILKTISKEELYGKR